MKQICLMCGEPVISLSPRKKFCSEVCCRKFHKKPKPFLISKSFKIFKNIVAVAETAEEFKNLYRRYFETEAICND